MFHSYSLIVNMTQSLVSFGVFVGHFLFLKLMLLGGRTYCNRKEIPGKPANAQPWGNPTFSLSFPFFFFKYKIEA